MIRNPELTIHEVSAADYITAIAKLTNVTPASEPDRGNTSRHVEYFIATAFDVIQGGLILIEGAIIDTIYLPTDVIDEVALALIDAAKQQYAGYTNAPAAALNAPLAALGVTPVPQSTTNSMQPGLFNYLQLGAGMMP